jgi:hypothetical protein
MKQKGGPGQNAKHAGAGLGNANLPGLMRREPLPWVINPPWTSRSGGNCSHSASPVKRFSAKSQYLLESRLL